MIRRPTAFRTFACLAMAASLALGAAAKPKSSEGKPKVPDIQKANWIWDKPKAKSDGVFGVYFRKAFSLPAKPTAAVVLATADNGYDLYVNGSLIGGDAGYDAVYWKSIETYDVASLLEPGKNVLAIKGQNMGGPAGLLAAARIELPDGETKELFSDETWKCWLLPQTGWQSAGHDDSQWRPVAVLGPAGASPWGKITYPGPTSPERDRARSRARLMEPGPDYSWPAGAVFLRGRVPKTTTNTGQNIWPIAGTHAYLEFDILAPAVLGRQLHALRPVKPDGEMALLHDAGQGVIGSPSVSYDGQTVYFAMAPAGEPFFQIYRIGADGSGLAALTEGPWHHYDPQPLPNGRIVFSSTRIGSREEYHGNSASCLFTMAPDGSDIRPLTYHIVGDHEPRVTATGSIAFVRRDIFFERAKVETQIHQVRPDGTGGVVLLGADRQTIGFNRFQAAEENSAWLRRYGFGSPAPLPDGRVAAISNFGLVLSGQGTPTPEQIRPAMKPFDMAPLPDGRLLCTLTGRAGIGILHPDTGDVVMAHGVPTSDAHSVAYLGQRPTPPRIESHVDPADARRLDKTGLLLCQNAFYTKQQEADLSRVRAIRVYEGRPLSIRSTKHHYVHIGVEAVELGTVPLAPDGSFYARVPADRALALQAVDAEGRPVINEATWIYVRPGERRTCVGCHSPRPGTPSLNNPVAARVPPVDLLGQGDAHSYRGNNAANGGVLNLQYDRFREMASINLYRQQPLPPAELETPLPPGRPTEVKRLCKQLHTAPAEQKLAAARRLAIFRDRAAVPALAQALEDESPEVRVEAAVALAACGNRDAVPPLLDALEDRSPHAAQAAHVALENLTGHTMAFNGFADASRESGAQAWRAWLGDHDWTAIEKARIQELSGDDPAAVQKAIEALGHVGGDAARAALRTYLEANHETAGLLELLACQRALGHLEDPAAVPLLASVLRQNIGPAKKKARKLHELGWVQRPIHLAAGAAEALGWIATPEAEQALLDVFPTLRHFWDYTFRAGDHSWLMGCHSSPIHWRIIEAFDAMGTRLPRGLVPNVLRSVPLDTDRGLLVGVDAYETVAGRVVQRSGHLPAVLETALAVLGDPDAQPVKDLRAGVTASPPASSTKPLKPQPRAAQILSVCALDPRMAPRVTDAFNRLRDAKPSRQRSWSLFFLARTLGRLDNRQAVPSLMAALRDDPKEAELGYVDPPNVFIYASMFPFYRAAAAHALGAIGDPRGVPVLLDTVGDFSNAMDVRRSAAQGLGLAARPGDEPKLRKMTEDYPEIITRRTLLRAAKAAAEAG